MKRMIKAPYQSAFELELIYPDYEVQDGSVTHYMDVYQYGPYSISVDQNPSESGGVGDGRYTWVVNYNPRRLNPKDVSPDDIVQMNYYGAESYDQALQDAITRGINPNRSDWE